jgi:hypothetical protein
VNKIIKYSLIGLLIVFGGMQFFPVDFPENRYNNPDDIFLSLDAPAEVSSIVRTACYDCHSMETNFPWYARVAPVSWWIIDHIEEGRDELNFSDFDKLPKRKKLRKLKDITEEVEKKKMPLPSYLRGHPEARLTEKERVLIQDWADQSAKNLLSKSSSE